LHDLTMRWNLIGSFVVVRFLHPTRGPAGAIALSATTLDTAALHYRLKRVTVIPLTDLGPYVPRWERGETVVVEVSDHAVRSGPPLRRHAGALVGQCPGDE